MPPSIASATGEASPHVQGESLKGDAAVFVRLFNSPVTSLLLVTSIANRGSRRNHAISGSSAAAPACRCNPHAHRELHPRASVTWRSETVSIRSSTSRWSIVCARRFGSTISAAPSWPKRCAAGSKASLRRPSRRRGTVAAPNSRDRRRLDLDMEADSGDDGNTNSRSRKPTCRPLLSGHRSGHRQGFDLPGNELRPYASPTTFIPKA